MDGWMDMNLFGIQPKKRMKRNRKKKHSFTAMPGTKNPIRKPGWHLKFPSLRLGAATALQCKPKYKRKMEKKTPKSQGELC